MTRDRLEQLIAACRRLAADEGRRLGLSVHLGHTWLTDGALAIDLGTRPHHASLRGLSDHGDVISRVFRFQHRRAYRVAGAPVAVNDSDYALGPVGRDYSAVVRQERYDLVARLWPRVTWLVHHRDSLEPVLAEHRSKIVALVMPLRGDVR